MNLKKMCAALMSGVMAFGALLAPFPENGTADIIDPIAITAEAADVMRRPCGPDNPMLIVHIDTWNVADPAKIIATIPEDIKPYCVFNISLSINWSSDENRWLMVQDGYECAKSWLKTCADEGVWCMVQPASGGQCHLPDYDSSYNIVDSPNKSMFVQHADEDYENTIYAEFFRDYPNFIGFNYSEQFWGFDSEDHPCTYQQRYSHFSHLLELCDRYGGYLNINWCANRWSAPLNPVAMLKTNTEWRQACEKYSDHLQLEEKYTQGSFIQDVESEVLGAYLSGYCGNFGVRYDETGWTDLSENNETLSSKDQYRQITGLPIHLERMALNGATIIDGPELVWADDFGETWGGVKDSEGYSCRNWYTRDQYYNSTLDFFRKVIDGAIRIPTRQEVVDRTKFVVIQDNSSGDDHNKYSTYPTLFEGLYRMSFDGNLWNNTNLFKSTGRYPTIPTVYALRDDVAKSFKYQLKQSQLGSRWSSISAKQQEFNNVFASEYVGNCYAGRYENTWVTYNPNKRGDNCGGILNLKYNTCTSLDVNFNAYGNALIREYSDHIDIYANNFDNKAQTTLKTDTFKVNGCSSKPTYTAVDTGRNQTKSQITESYSNGTYTLTVKHNGPVSITINCKGNETGRLTSYTKSTVEAPDAPSFYTGVRQYEGEFFDVKNVEGYVQNACGSGVTRIQGQGFLKYGKNANAAVKDTVKTQKAGQFTLNLRYSSASAISNVDLYVNGSKIETMNLSNTNGYSNWKTYTKTITLNQGDNKIEFKSNSALPSSLYIDNFTVEGVFGDGTQNIVVNNGNLITKLNVNDTENSADWSVSRTFTAGSVLFGDRDFTAESIPMYLDGAEAIKTACDSKMITTDLGKFTAGADITVYAAFDSRVTAELPAWLSGWTKTDDIITTSNELTLELYKKNYKSGDEITLGTNGGNGNSVNYIILAVEKETEPMNGTLIRNLDVIDKENSAEWSIQNKFNEGSAIYGDRDITAANVPANLVNAEMIRTACDSKMYTGDEASFTAAEDITAYAAVDTRVSSDLEWLKAWTYAGMSINSSNDVEFALYKLNVNSGEKVVLGTNGGLVESANYMVFAVEQEKIIKGDIDLNGRVDSFDMILARKGIINGFTDTRSFDAADIDSEEKFESDDLQQLQNYLSGKTKKFTTASIAKPQPKDKAEAVKIGGASAETTFEYSETLQYTAAPAAYRNECSQQGTVEKVTYNTTVYSSNLTKSAYVYLPYGYDSSKQYDIMYMMHGGGGNESSIFIESTVMKKYLDNMIMNGDIEPMIVVTPTFNNAEGSDMTSNAKNFWNELAKDIIPAVEGKYSTYAASTSAADLKASRGHRAFSGFSMGSLTAWYVFLNELDYFKYVMPLSGDCWAGSTADEKAAAVENAAKKSGYAKDEYFLMCATGTKDIAYTAMNEQIEAMKKLTDTFTFTSDFSKGNLYFLTCEGGTHYWDGYIVDYIYDALPYFFHE